MKAAWVVLLFALLFPSAMAFVYFDVLGGKEQGSSAVQITYALSKIVQFALPLICLWRAGGVNAAKNDPDFAIPRGANRPRSPLILPLAFGVIVAGAIYLIAFALLPSVLADTPPRIRAKVEEFGVGTPGKFIGLAVFLCLIHSFLEEYYWRWFVHRGLRLHLSFVPAALISSLGFMGHHVFVLKEYFPGRFWSAALPFSLGIAVGGFAWAWLYERSQSLLGPWLSHLLVDAGIMFVGYQLVFT